MKIGKISYRAMFLYLFLAASSTWAQSQVQLDASQDQVKPLPVVRAQDAANATTESQKILGETPRPQEVFDRGRYIDLDEIKPGMKGYGLTVFHGSTPEKFEVEVVSVMRNYELKRDAFLIRCLDKRFDIARGVQGCSGSPVYFDGRMAGAMAFGWAYSEEPIYGVTPIREMLQLKRNGKARESRGSRYVSIGRENYQNLMRDNLLSKEVLTRLARAAGLAQTSDNNTSAGLATLPLAVSVNGINAQALDGLRKFIPELNLQAGVSGGGGLAAGGAGGGAGEPINLIPGGTITVPLITGDMNGCVLGTVTEVADGKVYAFGHMWNGEGPTNWPMGNGYIHTFVNRQNMSFKLGEAVDIVGTLRGDEASGVYGEIGAQPEMIPVRLSVQYPNAPAEKFNVRIVQDELMDPVLGAMVLSGAVLQKGGVPREHAIKYRVEYRFDKLDPIKFENFSSAAGPDQIIEDTLLPLALVLNNPWEKVKLTGIDMTATVEDQDKVCTFKSARIAQRLYHPGEKVAIEATYEPLFDEAKTFSLALTLPENLPDGTYQVALGADDFYRGQLSTAYRYRYTPYNAADVQRILQERLAIGRSKLYLCMVVPGKGLAVESQGLPDLPGSRSMLLTDSTRQVATTTFSKLESTSLETGYLLQGGGVFEIEVKHD